MKDFMEDVETAHKGFWIGLWLVNKAEQPEHTCLEESEYFIGLAPPSGVIGVKQFNMRQNWKERSNRILKFTKISSLTLNK